MLSRNWVIYLYFFNRVKELSINNGGVNEESQNNADLKEYEEMASLEESMEDGEDELLNDEELPSLSCSFQKTMCQIEDIKEKTLEELGEAVPKTKWSDLMAMKDQLDYDMEGFVSYADKLIEEHSKSLLTLGECVNSLRVAMELQKQNTAKQNKRKHQ
ncbi:kinesin-like protein KIF2C [Protopterus annectens]|uniref:kinesin-like protein KIF2C n=1 Tax=Protopterus annectens TaxID=7888 RepID=UPI001CFBB99A|nr:kinesin-like protein KIF2C [Protopterus annectens]